MEIAEFCYDGGGSGWWLHWISSQELIFSIWQIRQKPYNKTLFLIFFL
jgi:hypothetical protein